MRERDLCVRNNGKEKGCCLRESAEKRIKAMKERVCFYKAEIDTLLDSEEKKAR